MPAPSKPLVSPRLLAREAAALPDPTDAQRQAAARWARTSADPAFVGQNEKPHQGKFLADLFGTVLGYRQFADAPDRYELKAESASSETAGGKTPDASLGRYGVDASGRTVAVVELKGPGADLDAPQRRAARLTPVEQAFGYVSKFDGCRWVVVSNFTHVRLYRADRGEGYAVEVRVADLGDDQVLRELLAVLHRDRLLGSGSGPSPTDRLVEASKTQEVEITAEFYKLYRGTRLGLFRDLVDHNPAPEGTPVPEHERALLAAAQTLLDRTLFVCFCEDTGLLPREVLRQALTAAGTGFVTTSRWDQLRGLFRAVDQGNASPRINAYNGGLFAPDPVLDALAVPDEALAPLLDIAAYDFNSDLSVDILGRIFERSIADLEALHAAIDGGDAPARSKRKSDGVFYTPEFVTRFVVAQTVGAWLAEQFEAARAANDFEALPESYTKQRAQAERALWLDYQDRLRRIKVLDPACGSGAFLVAAFDYLHAEYQRVNRKLASFEGGQAGLFDLDRQILQENLYGVDLNAESVEITRLSLWLKTARTDRPLSNLDQTIRTGDSLVVPPESGDAMEPVFDALPAETRARAFDWHAAFPEVFGGPAGGDGQAAPGPLPEGGFDCVLGNPPYVRAEWFTELKPYLAEAFDVYHGSADLYAYFVEQGARLLAPGGKLAYIVSNKWMRAGYGEPLRAFLAEHTVAETVLDFGHAPVFEDADTFPVILSLRVPADGAGEGGGGGSTVQVATVPRERLREAPLAQFVAEEAFRVPWSRFSAEPWSLEPPAVDDLMERLRRAGPGLAEFAGVKPYRGVVTGLNAAFLVDQATRDRLVAEDGRSAEIIKPFLRGSDVSRWSPEWGGEHMVFTRRGIDIDAYPAVKRYLEGFRERLEPKPSGWSGKWPGRKGGAYEWYEIQDSVDYYDLFDGPKLVYQEIQFHPQYALDTDGLYGNNKVFLLPTDDLYLLGVLNSPLMWWYAWRYLPHMKDDALSPAGYLLTDLPIAEPSAETRDTVETHVADLVRLADERRQHAAELLDWLCIEHGVATPGRKLESFWTLDDATFAREVKKRSGHSKLSPALLREILDYYAEATMRLAVLEGSALAHERAITEAVFDAYGITPDERALVWKTAPPRMPLDSPV
ncbi:MAG: DNA methyltransferase [Bacteroidota bacterium]